MAGWFELSRTNRGLYCFVLKAANGETILSSELYTSRVATEAGIASVRANCTNDARYVKMTASSGAAYFVLKAANHQVIGVSQLYASSASRDAGIASVKANGTTSQIQDNT